MIPLSEALSYVVAHIPRLDPVVATLADARGCVLAEPVVAAAPVPSFRNSAMDGYALRSADVASVPADLSVVGARMAGSFDPVDVGVGQAVRIMTGAAVPDGADAVCMVENTRSGSGTGTVTILSSVAPGEAVREPGEDIAAGDVVLDAGTVLTPARIGLAATVGAFAVTVVPRARVGVLSTGDELVDGPAALRPGMLYDSNRPMLAAMVADCGCVPVDLGSARDDEGDITAAITSAFGAIDALVISGGVSAGDVDLVKVVIDRLGGGTGRSMSIAIRPAKPFAFGVLDAGRVPAFGLPGNPVSSAVSFELLARPALLTMMGHRVLDRARVRATAGMDMARRPDGRIHFARVSLEPGDDGHPVARLRPGQGSHQLSSLATADGLAVLGDGPGISRGEPVDVIVLGGAP